MLSGNPSSSQFLLRAAFTPNTFHLFVGLHLQAGEHCLVQLWGSVRPSLELMLLGTAVLGTGTEIADVTIDLSGECRRRRQLPY